MTIFLKKYIINYLQTYIQDITTKQQKQENLPGVVKTKNHNKEKMIIKI